MATPLKCVVVGNHGIGKTTLLITYTSGQFPLEYIPILWENFSKTLQFNDKDIQFILWDIAGPGQENHDKMDHWFRHKLMYFWVVLL